MVKKPGRKSDPERRGLDTPQFKSCDVCRDPRRGLIEQAYLTGDQEFEYPYSRAKIETHVSHLADQESLALIGGAASMSGVAARLRMLESTTMGILDEALKEGDHKTALNAVKEARNSIELMSKLAGHLIERYEVQDVRPDIDAEIDRRLKEREETVDAEVLYDSDEEYPMEVYQDD